METRKLRSGLTLSLAAMMLVALLPGPALAKPGTSNGCDSRNNNTHRKLLECMTVEGVFEHLEAFQAIADANDDRYFPGTRAAGTAGYADSVDYVMRTAEAAGWDVELTSVESTYQPPAELRQLTPTPRDVETATFTGSGFGSTSATVTPVDLSIGDPAASTSGCEAADFAGFPAGNIALVQRGACFFSVKAKNAEAAGASAIIIFNQGTAGREGVAVGNASALPDGSPSNIVIPVIGASFADGIELSQSGVTASIELLPAETRIDHNVIAELTGHNDDNVVMAGSHLDSVTAGAGINDNGTGSAALLELAQLLGNHKPDNTIRLAWWSTEEQGLVGSETYVQNLPQSELDRIAAYLNFDMIGSPNHVFGVYDADESGFAAPIGVPIPEGSEALEDLFETYFTWQGVPYADSQFSGRSDYQEFILNGIPASGLFTGAEVLKTEREAEIWGGLAGAPFDICYHQACDNLTVDDAAHQDLGANLVGNVSIAALDANSDAIAFAVLSLAYSTADVNGVTGREAPGTKALKLPASPAGPEGPMGFIGGEEHDHDAVR